MCINIYTAINKFTKTDLPSVKFYEKLDNDFMILVDVPYCGTFSKVKYGTNGQIKELCKTYINYLVKQVQIFRKFEYKYMNCNSITYWLYDKLSTTPKMDERSCSNALSEINNMWERATENVNRSDAKSCKPYLKITSYHDNWNDAKKLFDYSMDFNYLKDMENNCNDKCDELCEYLNDINDIYERYEDTSSGNNKLLCPLSKDEYDKCNPRSLLDKFKCVTSTEELQLPKQNLSVEGEATEEEKDNVQEETIVEGGPGGEEAGSTLLIKEDSEEDSELISGESHPLSAFGNKFTPIGRQIQNKFPNMDNMIRKLSKKGNRSPTHRFETYNPFGEYLEENYIGYNPV
ncbi:variable surface protein [Plasmodium gonderi]|uniref:Variable surface protein n=1 Tax=Plasmodium gonderi TaxID=77519 RepID=A0A1Y1JQ74_PLAGO|nr:variable surface protein [Plasmodium gonderi]GAW84360.1 variable surface protein [Plasmodium gonderi]